MIQTVKRWLGWETAETLPMPAIKPMDDRRSPRWPTVRAAHLKREPFCRACGTRDNLSVHHKIPFHRAPEIELDPGNLITLCESDAHNCHLIFGHLLSWHAFNPTVVIDADCYRSKVDHREEPP